MSGTRPAAVTCLLMLLIALAVSASSGPEEKHRAVLHAGEIVTGPYFAFGDSVEISGTVNGDLYAAGGQVVIDGNVNGDLLVAGGTVLLSGRVSQDVRLAGGQVTISGEIVRNLTLAGGQVDLTREARIGGGVVAAGGNIRLTGPIREDVVLAAGQLFIDNRIGGDVKAWAGEIRLASRAAVDGDLIYRSEEPAAVAPQAQIGGRVLHRPLPEGLRPSPERVFGIYAGFKIVTLLMNLVSTLILGLLLIHFLPRFSRRAAGQLQSRPLASLGLGFAVLVLVPVLAGLLALTLFGLPLSLLLLAWFPPFLYLVRIFPIYWLGLRLFARLNRPHREKTAFLAGLLIYYLLSLLPLVSSLLALFVILLGTGMFLLEKTGTYGNLRERELV